MIVLEYISQSQNKIKTQKISISKQNPKNSINLNNLIVSSSTQEREREKGGRTKKEIKQKKAVVNRCHQHRFTHTH